MKIIRSPQKKFQFLLSTLALILLLYACSSNTPHIQGFNPQKWKADSNGCNGYRKTTFQLLAQKNKKQLIGLNEKQIRQLLGPPNRRELGRRSRRYYFYSVKPGPQCNQKKKKHTQIPQKVLRIRFSALNKANEILYIP